VAEAVQVGDGQLRVIADPGVVYQHIEGSDRGLEARHHVAHLGRVAEIDLPTVDRPPLGDQRGQLGGHVGNGNDLYSAGGEEAADGPPDTARATRDQRSVSVAKWHRSFFKMFA